ncbi:hypothetical protein QBC37DRAFT_76626 [Rhypophila decipiens]|uniref:Uncharacterized protein n=1 Tax=Rhypophila decipiens TaxID=261697 RepID=A0AAN7BDJ9_9PEZI|nr:hypothetical protein QBC37DRAFT_76626 [Rhypophila decipiens]
MDGDDVLHGLSDCQIVRCGPRAGCRSVEIRDDILSLSVGNPTILVLHSLTDLNLFKREISREISRTSPHLSSSAFLRTTPTWDPHEPPSRGNPDGFRPYVHHTTPTTPILNEMSICDACTVPTYLPAPKVVRENTDRQTIYSATSSSCQQTRLITTPTGWVLHGSRIPVPRTLVAGCNRGASPIRNRHSVKIRQAFLDLIELIIHSTHCARYVWERHNHNSPLKNWIPKYNTCL